MPDQQPPVGTREYLDLGAGASRPASPPDPGQEPPARGRGRRAWWIGGGIVGLLALGAGAWAALGFFQQGAQPAEALPASTVAYLSIDLDPSGGQKIDAFRTLNEFPAFKDSAGVNSVDDIRRKVGESVLAEAGCGGLTYDHDIDPWLGERAAVAAVDLGAGNPQPVFVLQVRDDGKARDAIGTLNGCMSDQGHLGVAVHGGWAVLAQSQSTADATVAAAEKATLADDASYRKWTDQVGEAGVVNMYAAPGAGDYLASSIDQLASVEDTSVPQSPDHGVVQVLKDFHGAAATIRFTGSGIELAAAGDFGQATSANLTGDRAGALASRLPDDTGAALAMSVKPGWVEQYVDQLGGLLDGTSGDQALAELSQETGMDLPGDLETLLGSGVAISIGKDIDLEAATNSTDGTGLPVAAVIEGDSAAIEHVLDKVRAKTGDVAALDSDSSGDLVAVGPTPAYRQHVLAGGHLGDTDAFRSVVSEADHASGVFFIDLDALEPALTKAAAGDQQVADNLRPLQAIGASAWTDGRVSHFSLKIGTD